MVEDSQPSRVIRDPTHEDPGYAMQNGDYLGGNEDLSRVIYASSGQQTTDAPPGDFRKLYEWADGELRLVSKNPAEVPFMTGSSLPKRAYHSVSDDGKRIFFQNPADIKDADEPVDANVSLYLREDGERTIEVSQSECSNACGTPAGGTVPEPTTT